MNIYRFIFIVKCPVNGKPISYAFELQKPDSEKVMVEDISAFAKAFNSEFHEQLADAFLEKFGGQQILKAHHHGVDIETHRGFETLQFDGRTKRRIVMGKTVFEKGVEIQTVADAAQQAEQVAAVFSGEYPR
jgi:hypothetical protein